MRTDTKTLALNALVLALIVLPLLGCKSTSTPAAPANAGSAELGEARELKLTGFTLDPEARKGAPLALQVRVSPNPKRGLNLTLGADTPDVARESLHATLSVAARMATRIAGRPLEAVAIELRCAGAQDGADIGPLLAAGLLALMKGAAIVPDAAVIGTLLVGTTVGPVAGLPQQLRAAASAGKKRVGYPFGQKRAYDVEQRKMVDVAAIGAELGLKLFELRTVYDAYAVLTGQKLVLPEAVPVEAMALAAKEDERILVTARAIFDQLRGMLAKEKGEAKAAIGSAAPADEAAARRRREADEALSQLSAALTERRAVKALGHALVARAAVLADRVSGALGRATPADLERGERTLEGVRVELINEVRLRKLRHELSLEHAIWDIAVYQRLLVAGLFSIWSRERLREAAVLARDLDEQKSEQATKERELAIVHGSAAWAQLQASHDLAALQIEESGQPIVFDETRLRDVSVDYLHAARSSLAYYYSTIKPLLAHDMEGMDEETLAAISEGVQAIPDLIIAEKWGSGSVPTALVRLAGAKEALVHAVMLMSAGLFPDEQDKRSEGTLLEIAERTAREFAYRAKQAVGAPPLTARLAYQLARVYVEAGYTTDALELYWRSTLESHVALTLQGALK